MLRFYANDYVAISKLLNLAATSLDDHPNENPLTSINHEFLLIQIEYAEEHFKNVGLQVCSIHASEIKEKLQKPEEWKIQDVKDQFHELYRNVMRELQSEIFYHIPKERAQYSDPKEPLFGVAVYERFPRAIYDIEEAGKCLAFGRSTACVFHLMRVMEEGLKILAKALGIPYAPSWESYLDQINTRITAKHSTKSYKWKKVETFYKEVLGDLQMVKIAWRNPTMHIVRKYTPEEAEGVFGAVRTTMNRLAAELSLWRKKKNERLT
jgi:hypothetical protein